MAHVRSQIRDALIAALADAGVVPAGRIYRDRAHGQDPGKLPAARVYFMREKSETSGRKLGGGRILDRSALFAVHFYATGEGIDDALDDLAAAAEAAIGADPTLGGLVLHCVLAATEAAPFDPGGSRRAGEMPLAYEVRYRTAGDDATATL